MSEKINKVGRPNIKTKTRNYSIRFDLDLQEFIGKQPNLSRFINDLIRKEKEKSNFTDN